MRRGEQPVGEGRSSNSALRAEHFSPMRNQPVIISLAFQMNSEGALFPVVSRSF
jgi:hypothetical protein